MLFNRTKEHGWSDKQSAVNKHFQHCSSWKEIVGLFEIFGSEVDQMQFQINAVRENTKILKKSDNWLKLAFHESLSIKDHKPELENEKRRIENSGAKVQRGRINGFGLSVSRTIGDLFFKKN